MPFYFCVALLLLSCISNNRGLRRFEFQQPQMGVPFRIVLYATDEISAQKASGLAFQRISELNGILSDYDYDSELSQLSRTSGSAQKIKVSNDLYKVLSRSQFFAEQSRGAFDVSVGPAVNLWRKARREKKFPDETRLAEARNAIGFDKIKIDSRFQTVELIAPQMRLDPGGIAKGYAVDEAMKILKANGIRRALVSGGGDIAVSEPPPGKSGWKIEMPPLVENSAPAEFLLLRNKAMATSGDLFQFVELNGKRYSHIVDPRTGLGLTDQSRVIVIAENCMTADALSTSVSVLGPERGFQFAKKFSGTAVHISHHSGEQYKTTESENFRRFIEVR